MQIRAAELQEISGPEFLGATAFDESSQFLARAREIRRTPEEFVRQQMLEETSLVQQLLKIYPEFWRGKFGSPEEFINDKINLAKQATEQQFQVTGVTPEQESRTRLDEMDAQLKSIQEEIKRLESGRTQTEE